MGIKQLYNDNLHISVMYGILSDVYLSKVDKKDSLMVNLSVGGE